MIDWFGKLMRKLEREPVNFLYSDKCSAPFYLEKEHLPSFPTNRYPFGDLSNDISDSEQEKRRDKLFHINREVRVRRRNRTLPQDMILKDYNPCVEAAILAYRLCLRDEIPCRLVTCVVKIMVFPGMYRYQEHIVLESNGMIIDVANGMSGAPKPNTDVIIDWYTISDYTLTKWHLIYPDKRLQGYKTIKAKIDTKLPRHPDW